MFIDNEYKADETWLDKNGGTFHPGIHYYVGGNSKVYGAALLRMGTGLGGGQTCRRHLPRVADPVPENKGNPLWHRPGLQEFVGIDHTATTVRNTDESVRFYRDLLGLTIACGMFNMGVEQEFLDSLSGARA